MSDRLAGVVDWFRSSLGYGFIKYGDGQSAFVHHSGIRGEPGEYTELFDGQKVSFEIVERSKGPAAVGVVVLDTEESPVHPLDDEGADVLLLEDD